MFKKLRKDLKALSEEVELSASTGQEVDLDELNEDEEVDAAEVETEKELTGEETLEEMISLFEDEVIEMGAEDAERLMTEDDDEDEEEKEDEEDSKEDAETLEEGVVERDLARGAKLGERAAKFIAKQEAKADVKSVKYAVREATTEEIARLAKKRQLKVTLLFGLAGRLYNKKASEKYEVGNKASVISVEVKKENGEVSINIFSGITNLKPSEVKAALERKLQIARKDKSLKEDDEVVANDEKEAKLDTIEEAYNFLFEDDEVETGEELTTVDSSDELVDKEIQEMISFLEDEEEEAERPAEDEIKEKEKEAEQAVAEALNAVRALRKAKKARR